MIIGLGGKMGSGKTFIGKYLEQEHGFVHTSFGSRLKHIISEFYQIELWKLYDPHEKEKIQSIPWIWDKKIKNNLEIYLGHRLNCSSDVHIMPSIRHILQFVGTEVLRSHDPNFHVNELKKIIQFSTNINHVVDDVRFPNEIETLLKIGAITVYVERPGLINSSTHESETILNSKNFIYTIINSDKNSMIEQMKEILNES